MHKSYIIAALLCLISVDSAARDWSWLTQYKTPNMHIGPVAMHPYYTLLEVYDSNIYLVPRDEPGGVVVGGGNRESWITKNRLGFEALLPWRKLHSLDFGYGLEAQNYTTQPSVNNAINQVMHADYVYKGAYGVTLKAGDKFINTNDQAFSELTGRIRRWMNRAYVEADYDPTKGRLAAGVDASQENHKYVARDLAQLLNRYHQSIGFNVGYKVKPKTRVYVAYHRSIIHYSVPSAAVTGLVKDNRSHEASLGVTGQLAPKVEGRVEAGVMQREYDRAPVSGGPRVYVAPTVTTAVTFKPGQYTTLDLSLSRFFQESIDANNPFYYSNRADFQLRHRFPRKISAGLHGAVGVNTYKNAQTVNSSGAIATRRDDLYEVGGWLAYDIQKWLMTSLAYDFAERNSTLSGQFSFQVNRITLSAGLKF